MQVFGMQPFCHGQNKIHKIFLGLFLKLFKNSYFAEQLLMAITLHDLSSLSAYIVIQECCKTVVSRLQCSSRL